MVSVAYEGNKQEGAAKTTLSWLTGYFCFEQKIIYLLGYSLTAEKKKELDYIV